MRVKSVRFDDLSKRFRLANDRELFMHRYCCLGPGDDVVVYGANRAHSRCRNGRAQILPIYQAHDFVKFGTRTLPLTIKEIETEEELAGYHQLEKYHYRDESLHGRRVPLIMKSHDPLLPAVLGYVELSTTFIMNKSRASLFDDEFTDDFGKISWTSWKKATVRQFTNLVARIARTVVAPEFRGLGLARVLVRHAAEFARDHWHVGGLKPYFLEITADMLRYVPFVESAGMHYIGETQGNLDRVSVDMKYILKNYERVKNREILKEETAGIVDLQVHYATQLKHIEEERGVPLRELLKMLVESPENLSDESWTLLHRILRLPKPTFMKGLTPAAEQFVKRRIKALSLPAKYVSHGLATTNTTLAEPIRVENCSFTISSFPAKTRSTRKIQQAFGVNRDTLDTTMFTDLSFEIYPGDVVLICGPSGAGKTTLLSLLEKSLKHPRKHHAGLEGSINVPASVSVASLGRLHGSRPLINSLGRASFEEALYALNASGLAEAHLYVKRPSELSNGQRYRAMVAKLIASRSAVWVADEFCATLDPVTANIVSRNLRRSAKDLGVTVITAAASWGDFIHELRPDTVVHLRAPWDVAVFSWDELTHALASSPTLGPNVTLGSS